VFKITGGAPNFHDAFNKEFYTLSGPRTRHISHIRLQGDHNNNKMERLNGEVRAKMLLESGLKFDVKILEEYSTTALFATASLDHALSDKSLLMISYYERRIKL
jgi:hypothetical protein